MRVPYSWLMEFLEADAAAEQLAEKLTMAGLEVEGIEEGAEEEIRGEKILLTKVTSNRGDLLSMLGVAREAAAVLDATYRRPEITLAEQGEPIDGAVQISVADPDLCPRYSARLVRDVKVGPSPQWMQKRLIAAGIRPISNVVDATNYVLWVTGQPLHAFDMDLLRGGEIIVRRARPEETIMTIDGELRGLTSDDLVIADAERPVALAGIMGGQRTEVTEWTKNVLIESAHFNPTCIRLTSLRIGLSTEASYRFERIVDPGGTIAAADWAAQLMAEIAGGEVAPGVIDVYPEPITEKRVSLRPERANQVLGTELSADEMAQFLRRLEFDVEHDEGKILVTVPTFRPDVEREIDLIEEVARIYGYNEVPTTLPSSASVQGFLTRKQRITAEAKNLLCACGLYETLTFSLTHPRGADMLCLEPDDPRRQAVKVANPMIDDHQILRTNLIHNALEAVALNIRRRNLDIALFEIGKAFSPRGEGELPDEKLRLTAVISGSLWSGAWNLPPEVKQADFYTLRGIAEQLLFGLGIEARFEPAQSPIFEAGRCASVNVDGGVLGLMGEVSAQVQENYDIPQKVYLLDLDFDMLLEHATLVKPYTPLPKLPPVYRDIALIVDADVPAEAVEQCLQRAGGELLTQVRLFDVFTGKPVSEGKKSLAFSLEFRTPERTLTDAEIDELIDRMVAAANDEFAAELRTG